jgi:hypothetical protein
LEIGAPAIDDDVLVVVDDFFFWGGGGRCCCWEDEGGSSGGGARAVGSLLVLELMLLLFVGLTLALSFLSVTGIIAAVAVAALLPLAVVNVEDKDDDGIDVAAAIVALAVAVDDGDDDGAAAADTIVGASAPSTVAVAEVANATSSSLPSWMLLPPLLPTSALPFTVMISAGYSNVSMVSNPTKASATNDVSRDTMSPPAFSPYLSGRRRNVAVTRATLKHRSPIIYYVKQPPSLMMSSSPGGVWRR